MLWHNQGTPNGVGRRQAITPPMLAALLEHLVEKPDLYQDGMTVFLHDEFGALVTIPTISNALASARWSMKAARRVAQERNAGLRDFYLHNLSEFRSYHLVYVYESGCDSRMGFRRTGWSPLGVAPVQVARFHRDERYQILPAHAHDGVVLARVFQGSTDSSIFEDFVQQLLQHCGRWPAPKSVLVMDNASFHHTDRVMRLCAEAGVTLHERGSTAGNSAPNGTLGAKRMREKPRGVSWFVPHSRMIQKSVSEMRGAWERHQKSSDGVTARKGKTLPPRLTVEAMIPKLFEIQYH